MPRIVLVLIIGALVVAAVPLALMAVYYRRSHHHHMSSWAGTISTGPPPDPWADGVPGYSISATGWYSCPRCQGTPCARCVRRSLQRRRR
jgi:hypothetical protein